jgi:glycosyltransferase involved in cell wall biosynthesis
MTHTARSDVGNVPASAFVEAPIGKVLALSGADREAVAHCRVLLDALRGGPAKGNGQGHGQSSALAREIVLATGPDAGANGLDAALDASDVGIVEIDGGTRWLNPLSKSAEAWKVARMLEAERPDVLHAVGVKPAALAALALQLVPAPAGILVHLPDLGALEPQAGAGGMAWPYRKVAVRLLASLLRKPGAFLLVGCDEDLAELRALGIDPGPRFAVIGGPGIDPDVYPVLPPAPGEMPLAACVSAGDAGGVRELMQAFERLWARGLRLQLELHGGPESDSPGGSGLGAEPSNLAAEWARWSLHPGVRCSPDRPADARELWRRAEICVAPSPARQGLPLALLEAAACGRALLVADAPGAVRAFVRHDVQGLTVPPGDAAALGEALERLARDAALRHRLGTAARLRVLQGFTEAHVQETLRGAYLSLARTSAG